MDKHERAHLRGKKSNKPSKKACNIPSSGNSDGDMLIEDDNTWECSVCTYRNSQEAFKCLMCDVCKGTSTRKPRYNHDLVAQQVKKQQIQIHQKLLKSNKSFCDLKDSSDSFNSSKDADKVDGRETRESKSKESNKSLLKEPKEVQDDHTIEAKGKESKGEGKEPRETRIKGGKGAYKSSSNKSDEGVDEAGPSVNQHNHNHHSHVSSNHSNHNQQSSPTNHHQHGSPTNHSPNNSTKTTKSRENSVKSTKMESKMKLKNIDRTNFLAQAVTVNNVTVIITEFQPKKKAKTTKKTYRQAANKKEKD
ncbi:YY1-associated factor 2 [Tetranychus urticae]|uniref:YY1-associated factor 2 n=1 Tax=Tetranychus urticae TaxID=32264 RepID=UPI00077BBA10|nr:YY1-associated factor 2 [Tetranychus urticae]XP_015786424.1 YY1-associated factor 2 [Tetranychus urticae]XP_015786425.1 YY1-associated factor 2 [Tetranychus urticae]